MRQVVPPSSFWVMRYAAEQSGVGCAGFAGVGTGGAGAAVAGPAAAMAVPSRAAAVRTAPRLRVRRFARVDDGSRWMDRSRWVDMGTYSLVRGVKAVERPGGGGQPTRVTVLAERSTIRFRVSIQAPLRTLVTSRTHRCSPQRASCAGTFASR